MNDATYTLGSDSRPAEVSITHYSNEGEAFTATFKLTGAQLDVKTQIKEVCPNGIRFGYRTASVLTNSWFNLVGALVQLPEGWKCTRIFTKAEARARSKRAAVNAAFEARKEFAALVVKTLGPDAAQKLLNAMGGE